MGCNALKQVNQAFGKEQVDFVLAGCSRRVLVPLMKSQAYKDIGACNIYLSVHDAVLGKSQAG